MSIEPIFTISNLERSSKLKIGNIDFSTGLKRIGYNHEAGKNPEITVTFDTVILIKKLRNLTVQELETAIEVLKPYVDDGELLKVMRSQIEEAHKKESSEPFGELDRLY